MVRPFMQGSWDYSEPMFTDGPFTPGANALPQSHNITPGGFLRGITLSVTSTGGVLGSGAISADAPWSVLTNISIESIDGSALYYPLGGYAAYLVERITRPWDRDPASDPAYSATINPSFRLRVFLEGRATLGVVPNTDARAQYRILYSIAPATNWQTGTITTQPTITVNGYLETYAQPPKTDLSGNPFSPQPDGLCLQRFISHQVLTTNAGDFNLQSTRVGNLCRSHILVFRDASGSQGGAGTRTNLGGDPIRLRLDNTAIVTEYRDRRDWIYDTFFGSPTQMATRPTGVYAYPWWHQPGDMQGDSWLETTEASFLQWEIQQAVAGGSCEIITEDLVPLSDVPRWMMGI